MTEFIETYTGKEFHFLAPTTDDFDIRDIAHALANTCRYTGHCKDFYSVAEHSINVSRLVSPKQALAGLLHDASEAYLTDVAKPVKPYLTNYEDMEDTLMKVISQKFGFEYPFAKEVKQADFTALSTEAYVLIPSMGNSFSWGPVRPAHDAFIVWSHPPKVAEELFLKRFNELL